MVLSLKMKWLWTCKVSSLRWVGERSLCFLVLGLCFPLQGPHQTAVIHRQLQLFPATCGLKTATPEPLAFLCSLV